MSSIRCGTETGTLLARSPRTFQSTSSFVLLINPYEIAWPFFKGTEFDLGSDCSVEMLFLNSRFDQTEELEERYCAYSSSYGRAFSCYDRSV